MKRIKLTGWRGGAGRRACCWWLSAGSKTRGSRNSCWFRWRRSGTYAEHPEWCTHGSSARSPCASTYPSPTSAILKRTKKIVQSIIISTPTIDLWEVGMFGRFVAIFSEVGVGDWPYHEWATWALAPAWRGQRSTSSRDRASFQPGREDAR